MGWTTLYKKDGLKLAKEINWKGIKSKVDLDVPLAVVSATNKKIASTIEEGAEFDVKVQTDGDGKARVLIGHKGKDITVDWKRRDIAGGDSGRKVAQVKAALATFKGKNGDYLKSIGKQKERVKKAKERIKVIESTMTSMPDERTRKAMLRQIESVRAELESARADGAKLNGEHQSWYLAGPRKGIEPLLKKFGLAESDLDSSQSSDFGKAVHEMSQDAGTVKAVFDRDIDTASAALLARLKNLQAKADKSQSEALKSVLETLKKEAKRITDIKEKAFAEAKVEKSTNVRSQLANEKSSKYRNFTQNPKFIKTEIESNNTRLGNIPKYTQLVAKQAKRVLKSVPKDYQDNPEIKKVFAGIAKTVEENRVQMEYAESVLNAANKALAEFSKKVVGT